MQMRAVEIPMVMQAAVIWEVHRLTMHRGVVVVEAAAVAPGVHQIQVCIDLNFKMEK